MCIEGKNVLKVSASYLRLGSVWLWGTDPPSYTITKSLRACLGRRPLLARAQRGKISLLEISLEKDVTKWTGLEGSATFTARPVQENLGLGSRPGQAWGPLTRGSRRAVAISVSGLHCPGLLGKGYARTFHRAPLNYVGQR